MKKPTLKMNKENSEKSIKQMAELYMNYTMGQYLEWFEKEGFKEFQKWVTINKTR